MLPAAANCECVRVCKERGGGGSQESNLSDAAGCCSSSDEKTQSVVDVRGCWPAFWMRLQRRQTTTLQAMCLSFTLKQLCRNNNNNNHIAYNISVVHPLPFHPHPTLKAKPLSHLGL